LNKFIAEAKKLDPQGFENAIRDVLHVAARNNQLECMRLLLDAGCPIEGNDQLGYTPLFAAVESQLMFIVGQNSSSKIIEIEQRFTYPPNGGHTDVTPAIEFLLKAKANPSPVDYSNHNTPLGFAVRIRQCFTDDYDGPEINKITNLRALLLKYHAVSILSVADVLATNPVVKSIKQMLAGYSDRNEGTDRYNEYCHKIANATRCSAIVGLAALPALIGPRYFKNITPTVTNMSIAGLTASATFLFSWNILPRFSQWMYGKLNQLKRQHIQRSLISTVDRLHRTNPDIHVQNALKQIFREDGGTLAKKCAERLWLDLNNRLQW